MLTKAVLRDAAARLWYPRCPTRGDQWYMCWAVSAIDPQQQSAFLRTLQHHGASWYGCLSHKDRVTGAWVDEHNDLTPESQSIRFMFLHLLAESGEFYRS